MFHKTSKRLFEQKISLLETIGFTFMALAIACNVRSDSKNWTKLLPLGEVGCERIGFSLEISGSRNLPKPTRKTITCHHRKNRNFGNFLGSKVLF